MRLQVDRIAASFDALAADEVAQRLSQRLELENDLLPHFEWRGRVVEAESVQRHARKRLASRGWLNVST